MRKLWERARSHRRGRGATEGGAEPQREARSLRGRRGATEGGAEPQICVRVCVCDATQKIISISSSIITNKK